MPALGDDFRSAREARGLTLSDVAEQIHIRSVYLNAIENEDWKSIGAPVYVRGFIRTYARYLGLDAEAAVARFNQSAPPPERPTASIAAQIGDDGDGPGVSIPALLGALVAIVLVGFVIYEWWQYAHGPSAAGPVAVATAAPQPTPDRGGSQPPSARPSATPGASAAAPHELDIRLTQRSWLRVSVDGATLLEGIFPAGTTRTFKGNLADVRAGNAGGVTVGLHGRPPVPMGKVGDVVDRRYTL